MVVEDGDVIKIMFTLKDKKGNLINSNEKVNGESVKIQLGTGQVLPELEKNLIGMEKGEEKEFWLTPQEAYGEFNPLLVEKIPKKNLKGDHELELGQQVVVVAPNGMTSPGWVRIIEDDYIVVDMNPPLAGKALHFEVKVLETDLEPDPVPNPFQLGISCESCDHEHEEEKDTIHL
jgi:FKBP-type peptidyl-prolyl cis-trans isomerase 2